MILKTYARIVTSDMDSSLAIVRALTGKAVDARFKAGDMEVAAIGNLCILAAPPEQQARLREVVGPVIVDDLNQTRADLLKHGAVVLQDQLEAPTGTVLYARNHDGVVMEWLQPSPDFLFKVLSEKLGTD